MSENSIEKQRTIQDMKDLVVRLEALESHAKMSCSGLTCVYVSGALMDLKLAIKSEEELIGKNNHQS